MKTMSGLIVCLFFCVLSVASLESAYQQENYPAAKQELDSLIQSGHRCASVFYNLSCVDYKLGNNLEALVNNRRSALYEPLDRDNNFNLPLLQRNFPEQNNIDLPVSVLISSLLSWSLLWGLSSVSMVCFIVLWSCFPRRFHFAKVIASVVSLIFMAMILIRVNVIYNSHQVIVSTERAAIRSGPAERFPTLYWVHQGLLGIQIGHRDSWSLIRLSNGADGWIEDRLILTI
jgi:hypothetical protein